MNASAVTDPHVLGMLDGRPRTGPRSVHFDLTNACNTRCTTCWHHSLLLAPEHVPGAAWKGRRMPLGRFLAVLDDLVALGGLRDIVLSGMGDPTLHPDLCPMVEEAHARGLGVTIITNLLRADLPRLLASEGRLHLLTSICGVTPETWQAFHAHPSPGGFERLMAQLAVLRRAGFRPKHVQVINAQNAHELAAMVRFAAAWPVERVNFKLASLGRGTEAVALAADGLRRLRDEAVPEALELAARLGVETDLTAFGAQIHPGSRRTAPIEDVGCFMGYVYARVTVDGDLLYCCNTSVHVGRLSDAVRFGELWHGERHQALRDSLRAGRYFRGCDQCGKIKQNIRWSQRLREALPRETFLGLIGRGGAP